MLFSKKKHAKGVPEYVNNMVIIPYVKKKKNCISGLIFSWLKRFSVFCWFYCLGIAGKGLDEDYEEKQCNAHKCPIDGRWSLWKAWGECSKYKTSGESL